MWCLKKLSKGISNFQIENAIENTEGDDLKDNFVGVFPSNYLNKFINHTAMISDKKGKYPFVIANTDRVKKKVHTGGVYSIYSLEQIYFSLILLDLMI